MEQPVTDEEMWKRARAVQEDWERWLREAPQREAESKERWARIDARLSEIEAKEKHHGR